MSITDTIHERSSYEAPADPLPTVDEIRALLASKQYFDNDYSPAEWAKFEESIERPSLLRCACNRWDCRQCTVTT